MAEQPLRLQRSVTSFRRQGSSGLVWHDNVVSGLGDKNQSRPKQEDEERDQNREPRQSQSQSQPQSVAVGSIAMMERSRSEGARPYRSRTVTVAPPSRDPPSPKATCALCGIFGKPVAAAPQSKSKSKSKKRR